MITVSIGVSRSHTGIKNYPCSQMVMRHDERPRDTYTYFFYVPGMMPDWVRDLLLWNPILHAIDWFRAGFFGAYQPHWLDRSYLMLLAIMALLVGLGLERGLRRRLGEPAIGK